MIKAAYMNEFCFNGLREGDADRLTHVNFAFALVKGGRGSVDHWKNGHKIREFIRNKKHIKAVLSVGGWGAGGFSPAVSTAEARELFAQTLVDIVTDYGFDGIDMDWEYPCDDVAEIEASPDDKVNYTLFMELLRKKMGPNKILSMAAGGMQKCADNLEIDKLMKVMDFINLMTYDICSWKKVDYHAALHTSHIGNNSGSCVTEIYEKAGVHRSKLVLGAGFYSRVYKDVDGINAPISGPPGFIEGGYKGVIKRTKNLTIEYDEKAEAPYAYDKTTREFITFENPRSVKAKMDYVKSTNMGGVMFWEYHLDTDDGELLRALG